MKDECEIERKVSVFGRSENRYERCFEDVFDEMELVASALGFKTYTINPVEGLYYLVAINPKFMGDVRSEIFQGIEDAAVTEDFFVELTKEEWKKKIEEITDKIMYGI